MPKIRYLSIAPEVIEQVQVAAQGRESILVCLDSNCQSPAHALAELQAYALLITPDSYFVVFDGLTEHLSANVFPDRP